MHELFLPSSEAKLLWKKQQFKIFLRRSRSQVILILFEIIIVL
ncbi:MAG: hypothetical protein QNJ38_23395 [Prochloraceae cyanobacterium]|nr:hypothetical protein [Prochloraceae cyanobacterium]